MQKQILNELKELRSLIAKLVGTTDLPPEEQFSSAALDKASKQFQKLSVERGEWVKDSEIEKYIKNAPYRCSQFLIKEFDFTRYFKRSYTYYFYKKDLIALVQELKKRNIDLTRYMELKEDYTRFQKDVYAALQNKNSKRRKKPFQILEGIKDITTSPIPKPPADIVKQDLENLKKEFFEFKLSEYIDIYGGDYAMMKSIYHFQKYIEPEIKKRCKKWVDNFNYANHAIKEITRKKEIFIPVTEDEMIEL